MTKHHKHATQEIGAPGAPAIAAVACSDRNQIAKLVSDEDIRLCAYQKWEAAGKPDGDGIQFWLEAEQALKASENEKLVGRDGRHGHREHERPEDRIAVKEAKVIVDSHYRDNNRMFQSHGERGHRHGGSG